MHPQKTDEEYFKVTVKKSIAFKIACLGIFLLSLLPFWKVFCGYAKEHQMPNSFRFILIIFGILEIIGSFFIYNFRKIGIYLFVIPLLADIFLNIIYGIYDIDLINGLYLFIGFALVPIIPRWKYFR